MHLHVCFGFLYVRVCPDVVANLSVETLPSTTFINKFVRGILPSERKVVLGYFQPLTIPPSNFNQKPASLHEAALICKRKLIGNVQESPSPFRIARQAVLELRTRITGLDKTSASDIHTFKNKALKKSMQMISVVYDAIVILLSHPFHTLLSNPSAKAMHLPIRIAVVHATDTPEAVRTS